MYEKIEIVIGRERETEIDSIYLIVLYTAAAAASSAPAISFSTFFL
jgi:hypothetical protein